MEKGPIRLTEHEHQEGSLSLLDVISSLSDFALKRNDRLGSFTYGFIINNSC